MCPSRRGRYFPQDLDVMFPWETSLDFSEQQFSLHRYRRCLWHTELRVISYWSVIDNCVGHYLLRWLLPLQLLHLMPTVMYVSVLWFYRRGIGCQEAKEMAFMIAGKWQDWGLDRDLTPKPSVFPQKCTGNAWAGSWERISFPTLSGPSEVSLLSLQKLLCRDQLRLFSAQCRFWAPFVVWVI